MQYLSVYISLTGHYVTYWPLYLSRHVARSKSIAVVVTFDRGVARGARWTKAEFEEVPLTSGLVVVDN
eukprot:SAG31_NODE_42319_length_272_cov_0.601156_1_plen_67_part_10